MIPNDQLFTNQYQHYLPVYEGQPTPNGLLDTPDAWDITTGSSNVTVAIIDSGIEENWELNGRLVRGYNVISNNFETGTDTYPFHGAFVATIVGANANNPLPGSTNDQQGFGIAGMDWQCRIMPIKVADGLGQTRASWGAQGIDFAVTNGCQVILNLTFPLKHETFLFRIAPPDLASVFLPGAIRLKIAAIMEPIAAFDKRRSLKEGFMQSVLYPPRPQRALH